MIGPVLAARSDQELDRGSVLPDLRKAPITKMQLVKYAGASGDYNLIHTDDETARTVGLEGVIAHGMLSMAFLGEDLGWPGRNRSDGSPCALTKWCGLVTP